MSFLAHSRRRILHHILATRRIAFFAWLFVTSWLPNIASGKSTQTYAYSFESTWSTAVRFLRVDNNYELTERDKESGFLLFVYPGSGAKKHCPASLELISKQGDTPSVRAQLTIADQPSYIEVHLLEKLQRKLYEDHGPPRTKPPKPKKQKQPRSKKKAKE